MNKGTSINQHIDLEAIKTAAIQRYGNYPGVEGIGIGDQTLRIYIHNPEVQKQLPQQFQDVPIDFVVTGDIIATW